MLEFRTITLQDRPWITQALRLSDYPGCEYSFANNMAWRRLSDSKIAAFEDFYICCAFGSEDGTPCFCYPAGEGDHRAVIEEMRRFSESQGHPLVIWNVSPERLAWLEQSYACEFTVDENRESWDYVYLAEQLATLSGRKYHQKRNFLHRFAEYGAVYTPLTERDFDDCITLAAQTYNDRLEGDHSGIAEQFAIDTFFRHFDALGLHGGVLRIDGRVIAFTIGEPLNSDTFCVHIEKADASIPGAFAAINQSFSAHIRDLGYTYINREEDMGLEGLRKAKESYHPCKMLEKRMVRFTL